MNETKKRLKSVELKLVSELIRNCRRSDRELAKAIGVSQPTVSRLIKKLEKGGYIKQYMALPDFSKLGYKILALSFIKLVKTLSPEEVEKARQTTKQSLTKEKFHPPVEIAMLERGMGLGYDGVAISYHENYSPYSKLMNWFRQFSFVDVIKTDSFLTNLDDTIHYRSLTYNTLAQHLLEKEKVKSHE